LVEVEQLHGGYGEGQNVEYAAVGHGVAPGDFIPLPKAKT
jgi:hypothetical protein